MNMINLRNFLNKLKLSTKLLIFCLCIILLPIILTGYYSNSRITQLILEQNQKESLSQLYQIGESLKNDISFVENLSDSLYLNESLQKDLLVKYKNQGDSAVVYTDIIYPFIRQDRTLHNKLLKSISIYIENESFLQNGDEIIYADIATRNMKWYSDLKNFTYNYQKIWDMNIRKEKYETDGNYTLSLYRRLDKYSGKLAGILRIQLNESYFASKLKSNQTNRNYYIINHQNNILSSNNREVIGESVSDFSLLKSAINEKNEAFILSEGNVKYNAVKIMVNMLPSTSGQFQLVSIIPDEELLSKVREARNVVILMCSVLILFLLGVVVIFSKTFTRRINKLAESTKLVVDGEYNAYVEVKGEDEISILGKNFNEMLTHLHQLINEVYEKTLQVQNQQLKQKETELISLQNQINPHFLYNTLEAIRMHAVLSDDLSVSNMLVSLANLLRYNIDRGREIVTLNEEIRHVENYMSIMKIRFQEYYKLTVNIPENILNKQVLKLILQPLVENSIKHGFKNFQQYGEIEISAFEDEGKLIIDVSDNGLGIDTERLTVLNSMLKNMENPGSTESIGLGNVNSRMKIFYGQEFGVIAMSIPKEKTTIRIILPV